MEVARPDNDLLYSSKEFYTFFQHSPRSLVLKADAPRFTILAVSDTYLNLVHRNRAEILGKGLFEAFPGSAGDPSEMNSVYSSFIRVIKTAKPDELPIFKYEIEVAGTGRKETHYWTNVNEPLLNDAGEVAYIINTTTNITGQVRQQQAVEESERRFRLMAEGTNICIAMADETSNAIYFNQAWSKLTGRSVEKLVAYGWLDLAHPEDKDQYLKLYLGAFEVKGPFHGELRILNKEGNYRWLLVDGTARWHSDGSFAGFVSVSIDITEQKEQQTYLSKLYDELVTSNLELAAANEELRQAQEYLVLTNEQLTESEAILKEVNQQLTESQQILQLTMDSSGMSTWQADLATGQLILPERMKRIHGIGAEMSMTLLKSFEMIDPAHRDSVNQHINEAIRTQTSFVTEYKIYPMDGSAAKWLRASGVIQFGDDGQPAYILGTVQDITEQKQNEQRKNDFISMVSHELKTPLTSMKSYIQVLQGRATKGGDELAAGMLDKANKQVVRMTTLINGFLNLSKLESAQIQIDYKLFDLTELIKEAEEDVLTQISSHKVVFTAAGKAMVNADHDKIAQVIQNLVSNAVKYSPLGSTVSISCFTRDGLALVSVKDEGMGISEADLPKLFERYYRTENAGTRHISGFGIGLYLCCEIVKRHEGQIWAESELGKGSTFYFSLPVAG